MPAGGSEQQAWVFEDACRTENCVSWSPEGTLAVVSGATVSLVDASQPGTLGTIPLKRDDESKSPLPAYGVHDYNDSYPDSNLLADLCVRWTPFFTCAAWSPLGLARKGGCLLVVASSDGQVTVHEAQDGGSGDWASPALSLCLSGLLFEVCKAAAFDDGLIESTTHNRRMARGGAIPQLDGAEGEETESDDEDDGEAKDQMLEKGTARERGTRGGRGRGRRGRGAAGRGRGGGPSGGGAVAVSASVDAAGGEGYIKASKDQEGGKGAKAAKHRVVQAFLGHFENARAALGDAVQVVEYAKAQRLSDQDSTLLADAGTWVLAQHAEDVHACGLDEAALRKLLQVELRLHWKNAKRQQQRTEGGREDDLGEEESAGGQRKRMRQAAVNAQQRLRDQAEGETHGGEAEGLEGVGQQGKDSKRKKKETLLKGVASEDEDEGGRGRGMARGVKRGAAVDVEDESDEAVEEYEIEEESSDDGYGRTGKTGGRGGGKRVGGKKGGSGRGGKQLKDRAAAQKRHNKLSGTVGFGTKGMEGDGSGGAGNATTREEAGRQRECLCVHGLAWRHKLVAASTLGLSLSPRANGSHKRDGAKRGGGGGPGGADGEEDGDRCVGLVAVWSRKVITLWALWRQGEEAGKGLGCALVAAVTKSTLAEAPVPAAGCSGVACVDWVVGETGGEKGRRLGIAVGSESGAVDLLVFTRGGQATPSGSVTEALGWMEVAVRVCPPGGGSARHIVCCALPCDAVAGGGETGKSPADAVLVIAKGNSVRAWDAQHGLVRAEGTAVGEFAGNVTGLSADGSGEHVAAVYSDGSARIWAVRGRGGGGVLSLVSRMTCDILAASTTSLLGGALSFHGSMLAMAGRRVEAKRGKQTLTFPTGLEGVLVLQRVPAVLDTAEARRALLSRGCAFMHAPPAAKAAVGEGYGWREDAGGMRWWWDLRAMVAQEMEDGEKAHLIAHLAAVRSRQSGRGGGVVGRGRDGEGGCRMPLHACVREEDATTSKLLLLLSANVEARDPKGSTALIIASVRGHAQTVEALLEHGADTGAADKDGLTALHWATAMGHEGVVRVLVQAGAGLGVTRPNGVSVEDLAHGATPTVRAALGLAP